MRELSDILKCTLLIEEEDQSIVFHKVWQIIFQYRRLSLITLTSIWKSLVKIKRFNMATPVSTFRGIEQDYSQKNWNSISFKLCYLWQFCSLITLFRFIEEDVKHESWCETATRSKSEEKKKVAFQSLKTDLQHSNTCRRQSRQILDNYLRDTT